MVFGGRLVVNVYTFDPDVQSSNPAEVYNTVKSVLFEKTENMQKEVKVVPCF